MMALIDCSHLQFCIFAFNTGRTLLLCNQIWIWGHIYKLLKKKILLLRFTTKIKGQKNPQTPPKKTIKKTPNQPKMPPNQNKPNQTQTQQQQQNKTHTKKPQQRNSYEVHSPSGLVLTKKTKLLQHFRFISPPSPDP